MRLSSLRRQCVALLEKTEIPRPFYEADLIFADVLATDRAKLHSDPNRELVEEEVSRILELTRQRAAHVPMAQLLGSSCFYGQKFFVNEHCLIPRPETEVLVRVILERFPEESLYFADWCTGSGCIGLSLLAHKKRWRGMGIDASAEALEIARRNAEGFSMSSRFSLFHSADPLRVPLCAGELDFIVANPPYIATPELPHLMPEVRDHEPRIALDGGEDGLDLYRLFFGAFPRWLAIGGSIFFETGGEEQISLMCKWHVPQLSYESSFSDDFGVNRFMVWRRTA